jgi:murein L,D-transpeptidase YafK
MRIIISAIAIMLEAFGPPGDFLTQQKHFEKVRTALGEKQQIIETALAGNGLETANFNMLIIAYKDEGELEIYAKKKTENAYRKLVSYRICSSSGELGPKRREGDYQVPEGFYHINMFNPYSRFFLSLGIDYPNLSDKRKSKASRLGGNIFIHGACVTIGCIPMTDEAIKEIYLYAVYAKNNGQTKIPVYLFPFRMTDENFRKYSTRFSSNRELVDFWANLKTGYDKFALAKKDLKISVDMAGNYGY